MRFEFRNWSGARDLNPGPHGPEPCWLHVLQCPGGSPDARLNSNCHSLVSVCVPLGPPGAGNPCPGCAPARASKGGDRRPPRTSKWHLLEQALTTRFSALTQGAAVDSNHLPPRYHWAERCADGPWDFNRPQRNVRCYQACLALMIRGDATAGAP